ncbi:hypothetical protein [Gemmata obscuriglobus]|nr:hypothetical protein [Gemmata obscuriglobus]
MAQAKIQLAEAELAKARQTITLKVLALKSRVEQGKAELRVAEQHLANQELSFKAKVVPESELFAPRSKFETAKATLAAAEAEWKLLTGPDNNGEAKIIRLYESLADQRIELSFSPPTQQAPNAGAYRWYGSGASPAPITGPIPDRLRAVLDKPVKVGPKGEKVTFDKALEAFQKQAGFDIPIRGDVERIFLDRRTVGGESLATTIISEGETLPIGAWLQLFQDIGRGTFYVREYGLLVSDRKAGPPDAPTFTEFWKQAAPKPEPKPKSDPVPEPKPK